METHHSNFQQASQEQRTREIFGSTAYRISNPDEEAGGKIRYGLNLPNGLGVLYEESLMRADFDGSREDQVRIFEREAGFFEITVRCQKANNFEISFDPSILCKEQVLEEVSEYLQSWTPDSPRFRQDRDLAVEAMGAPELTALFRSGAREFERQFPQDPSFIEPDFLKVSDALVRELENEIGAVLEFMPEQRPEVQRINYKVYSEALKRACSDLADHDMNAQALYLQLGLLMTERYLPRGFSKRVDMDLIQAAVAGAA